VCQSCGIVPIVEPEVLSDGEHNVEVCALATQRALAATVEQLLHNRVLLEGILLKPNMVTMGFDSPERAAMTPDSVAEWTVKVLMRTIPPAVPGIFFLSGGQSEDEASQNLNAINIQAKKCGAPWRLTFSFGRALQASCIKTWDGKFENVGNAQQVFISKAVRNGDASLGKLEVTATKETDTGSLFEKG